MTNIITKSVIETHGLTNDEYQQIYDILGRIPNLVELGIFSVMWSEHCSYKSTRRHLSGLHTTGEAVIQGPGENAGVIDIGDGDALIFKMESHNHPSFIAPFYGASTGVGGIMRDIFTMGARPIALLNALSFGSTKSNKTKHHVQGVVKGISYYGNCVGVPTIGGETRFDESYNGNILVNAMCIGLARQDKIFYSAASQKNAKILYVGAKTGRDGIHGATMASAEFDDDSENNRPTIQVGDPFMEKLLIEACLELMATDYVLAVQDMGAAGLTCSSIEMADKGNSGIELNLNLVPQRETDMTPYEIMLSESQERMLFVIREDKEEESKKILQKWDLDAVIIGKITDTSRMILKFDDEIVADMPVEKLANSAPIYDRPYDQNFDKSLNLKIRKKDSTEVKPQDILSNLQKLCASEHCCSRRYIWEQYDSRVGNDTIISEGQNFAAVKIHKTHKALVTSVDVTPRYVFANPYEGAKQAVIETYRNISSSGAKPIAITNCLNFGNPEREDIMTSIAYSIEGISDASKFLNYPVISGNVSLYNETNGNGILPTPSIGGVGLIKDYKKLIGSKIRKANSSLYLIGDITQNLENSLFEQVVENKRSMNYCPTIDLEKEETLAQFLRNKIQEDSHKILSSTDISDGGLLLAIFEMVSNTNKGIKLDINLPALNEFFFSESQACYIVEISGEDSKNFLDSMIFEANEKNISSLYLGSTIDKPSIIYRDGEIELSKLYFDLEEFLG